MSATPTGNAAFDAAAVAAETARQAGYAAIAASNAGEQGPAVASDIQVRSKAIEIAYFRSLRNAALANNLGAGPYMAALLELGIYN
jgi:hypothetical protein